MEQNTEQLLEASSQNPEMFWIIDHDELFWAPGKLIQDIGEEIHVQCIIDNEYFSIDKPALEVHPSCLLGVDNLLSLGEFNEGSLLHTIRTRFQQQKIFTSIGSPILVSVNPYQKLKDVFTTDVAKLYREHSIKTLNGTVSEEPAPHLFTVAEGAYQNLRIEKKNQSIIISGESGAGKTEATKIILCYLAQANSNFKGNKNIDFIDMQKKVGQGGGIEKQVLDSNPLLEAFGNAKTFKNNNSSRFGKFIKVNFNKSGQIQCAQIQQYLLEKSRVVFQLNHERNFHIFYQVLAFSDFQKKYKLLDKTEYHYVNQSGVYTIPQVNDSDDMAITLQCMRNVGFTQEEIDSVIQIVVAILNLGNVVFIEGHQPGVGPCAKITEESKQFAQSFGRLVGLQSLSQIESLLTMKIQVMMNENISMNLTLAEAQCARDSIAKSLFKSLFTWIVKKINFSIANNMMQLVEKKLIQTKFIGILDIFGFEIFKENSFEQLCINYANEKLQHQFNQHMFSMEQEEYKKEKVQWENISFVDNLQCIDLIESPKTKSVFKIMDEECMVKGTEQALLKKLNDQLQDNKYYGRPKKIGATTFIIKHYAGNVEYDINSFLEKNQDIVNEQITTILKQSDLNVVKQFFLEKQEDLKDVSDSGDNMMRKFNKNNQNRGSVNSLRGNTLSNQFRLQLNDLISTLQESSPRYIRCIKPNSQFSPTNFDSFDVCKQLRCAGMLEAIRIRKQGYAIRISMEDFIKRYRSIFGTRIHKELTKDMTMKTMTEKIMKTAMTNDIDGKGWQIGLTKVFMKEDARSKLEQAMANAFKFQIIHIQKFWRGRKARKIFKIFQAARLKQIKVIYKLIIRIRFRKIVNQIISQMNRAIELIQKKYKWRFRQKMIIKQIDNRVIIKRQNQAQKLQNEKQDKIKLDQNLRQQEAQILNKQKQEQDNLDEHLRQKQEQLKIDLHTQREQIGDIVLSQQNDESIIRDKSLIDELVFNSNYQDGIEDLNDFDSRLSQNMDRIRDTFTEDIKPESSIKELKAKFVEVMNENHELRDHVDSLNNKLEERDQQIIDLELKLTQNDKQSSKKDLNTIIRSFDFDIEGMYKQDRTNSDLELQLEQQEYDLSQLRQQLEVVEGDKLNKDRLIKSLREENILYQQKNTKWIEKLDDEIERNAMNVEELSMNIQQLKDQNFKLEFQLNQRPSVYNQQDLQNTSSLLFDINKHGSFDSASTDDLQSMIRHMQQLLRQKDKQLEEIDNSNFFLKQTVSRENTDLKIKNEKLMLKVSDQKLIINENLEIMNKKDEQIKKYKCISKVLEEKIQNMSQTQVSKPNSVENQRELEKLRSKAQIQANESENLKQQNVEYCQKIKDLDQQNEELIEKLQSLKKEKAKERIHENSNAVSGQQQYLIQQAQTSINELKGKYARVKDKCFKLNRESDFYNQTITVFLTIKKVLEKQNKFTMLLYENESSGSQKNDSGQNSRSTSQEKNFNALVENKRDTFNNLNRMTDQSNFSQKRNLFQKKQKQSDSTDDSNQRPSELKTGIQLCKDKLVQLDHKLASLMNQLKSNQLELLLPYNQGQPFVHNSKNSHKENELNYQTDQSNKIEF